MIDIASIDAFVDRLSVVELPNVFNPYRHCCPIYDHAESPAIRRTNLRNVLMGASQFSGVSMWIAQDLGYRGGRRTGLALTDEYHLDHHRSLLRTDRLCKATSGPCMAERTAGTIWHALNAIEQPIFLWNVFPFHPHCEDEPYSNRCHNRSAERDIGISFLEDLIKLLQPSIVIGIGKLASAALHNGSIDCEYARHPSYGGQTDFLSKIGRLYDLPLLGSLPKSRQQMLLG